MTLYTSPHNRALLSTFCNEFKPTRSRNTFRHTLERFGHYLQTYWTLFDFPLFAAGRHRCNNFEPLLGWRSSVLGVEIRSILPWINNAIRFFIPNNKANIQIQQIVQWFLDEDSEAVTQADSYAQRSSLRVLRVKNRFELPAEQVHLRQCCCPALPEPDLL